MRRFPLLLMTAMLVIGVLVTTAFRPASGTANKPLLPFMVKIGTVTVYVPGTGIMIQDDEGNTAAYFLDPSVRIMPPPRADTLAVGSRVIILAKYDPKISEWVVFASSSGGTQSGLVLGSKVFGYHGKVLGISIDEDEAQYRKFLQEYQIAFPTFRDPSKNIAASYGTFGWPETYVIDREGKIVRKLIGPQVWDSPEMIAYLKRVAAQ